MVGGSPGLGPGSPRGGESSGAQFTWPGSLGPPCKGLVLLSGGDEAVHVEDMAVHWSMQRTSGAMADEREQSTLDNYPSQTMIAKSGQTETLRSTVSANTHWKGSLTLGSARFRAFQNYRNFLGRTMRACATLGP